MAFDPLSWAIGYSLKKGIPWLLNKVYSNQLPDKLDKIAYKWSKDLPKEYYLEHSSLFNCLSEIDESRDKLKILRDKLNKIRIPDQQDWSNAILEQWNIIKKEIPNAQEFYLKDESEVVEFINDLSNRLYLEVVNDKKSFNHEMISRMDELKQLHMSHASELDSLNQKIKDSEKWKYDSTGDFDSDVPVAISDYIIFSDYLVRSIYVDPKNNRKHRRFNIRIKLVDGKDPLYNLNIKLYLVVKKLSFQPDGSTGYATNWFQLSKPSKVDFFLPILKNYWSLNYFIDPKISDNESPFFKYDNLSPLIDASIRVFLTGETISNNKVYAQWEYEWSREKTKFGRFKLRSPNQEMMTLELFNTVLETKEDDFNWPLLDIKKIGK